MASEQEREHALASFKQKLIESREWETKLKNLRLEIKGLQKEFDQTEDNIKALQSVGQIIGEVLKQLDDERCALPSSPPFCGRKQLALGQSLTLCLSRYSYSQSLLRPALRRRVPVQGRQSQDEAGDARGARHDDAHHHAHAAARGRPARLQHVARGPGPGQLRGDRRAQRPDPRAQRGD